MFSIFNFGRSHFKSADDIVFIRGPDERNKYKENKLSSKMKRSSIYINLYDNKFNILEYLPRFFTITTNNGSGLFNYDLLKKTSSVITEFAKENPTVMEYHIDIDDNANILGKIVQLYQGYKIIFLEDELPICKKITSALNIIEIPNYMKPESLKNREYGNSDLDLKAGVGISIKHLKHFINRDCYQTFKIITNKKEYNCNYFGIFYSNIIRNIIISDPTINQYKYDFDDENNEFQQICDFFNFKNIEITTQNMFALRDIADDLEIESILPKIDEYLNYNEKFSKSIDDQQNTIEIIDQLFGWLYDIDNLTVEIVKTSILNSEWVKTEDNVIELAAFIIQTIQSSSKLQPYLFDLLMKLDKEYDESNKLNILFPFVIKQLLFQFGSSINNCSFVYRNVK